MKISFIGFKDNPLNLFKELTKSLSKKISGLEVDQRFVPTPEDIPLVSAECCEESDFVVVFALLEDEKMAKFIKQKLIDVEIATKTRILKYVQEDDFSSLDEEDYIEKKQVLVDEISELIVAILFNEKKFEPRDKDFSL
ncbi:MAG: hypothetical protein WCW13_05925 [archaeon]|jgi:hypothetical protein